MQLRCVCKFWDHIIRSKSFIQDHLDHKKTSSTANKYLLIYCDISYLAHLIDNESCNVLRSYVYHMHDVFDSYTVNFLKIYGVCDGIICLSTFNLFSIYLWNSVIRKVKKLPYGIGFSTHYCLPSYTLCFGYHDDDHKVIKVVQSENIYHIGVYSLNTDSWKFSEFETSHKFGHDMHHHAYRPDFRLYPRQG